MISGAHSIIYSKDPDADRDFFRDVLGLPHVDVGHGWLIFGLPPAELAVHPAGQSSQELFLMCDDITVFMQEMTRRNVPCSPLQEERWGLLTRLTLPGGSELGVYQPRHARPEPVTASAKESALKQTGPGNRAAKPGKKKTKKR